MHKVTFYPIGNADCSIIETEQGKLVLIDYANMRDPNDDDDLRIDLENAIRNKVTAAKRQDIDVGVFTHGDRDHYKGFSELFYLEHASKYQSEERVKIKEMWIPAAIINDGDLDDEGKVLRAEARYRLKNKKCIKVFSRPETLKNWFDEVGLDINEYSDFFVDAGKIVPGFDLQSDGVEFFVHSPFAFRQDDGTLVDRNECSIVMQVCFKSVEGISKIIMSADTTWEAWEEIVKITKYHKNEHRLNYDAFKLPHHCSYLSLSDEKGDEKTTPKEMIDRMFKQANPGAKIISTSDPIPSSDTNQPPHKQAANYYKDLIKNVDGEFIVTMEYPKPSKPEPVEITVNENGITLTKLSLGLGTYISSKKPPRAG